MGTRRQQVRKAADTPDLKMGLLTEAKPGFISMAWDLPAALEKAIWEEGWGHWSAPVVCMCCLGSSLGSPIQTSTGTVSPTQSQSH
jgi:hypothetical protein